MDPIAGAALAKALRPGKTYTADYLGLRGVTPGSTPIDNTALLQSIMTSLEPGARIDLGPGVFGIYPGQIQRTDPLVMSGWGEEYTVFQPLGSATVPSGGSTTFYQQQLAAACFTFRRTSATQAESQNIFGYVRGLHLENFTIEGAPDLSIQAGGIFLEHWDEVTAFKVVQKKLPLGAWMTGGDYGIRECEFMNCYDWWCGTAPSVGPGQVVSDLASLRAAIGWPANCWMSNNTATGGSDQLNEIYFWGGKTVYAVGIAALWDTLDANSALGQYHVEYNNYQFESMGYLPPTSGTESQGGTAAYTNADVIWARSGRVLKLRGCHIGGQSGYNSGTGAAGWAQIRAGDMVNNRTLGHLVVEGGILAGYYTGGGGPGIVCSQLSELSLGGGLDVATNFSGAGNRALVIGKLLPTDTASTAPTVVPTIHLGEVRNLIKSYIDDPGKNFGKSAIGFTDSGRLVAQGVIDHGYTRLNPTSGQTLSAPDNATHYFVNAGATLASLTIKFPANPIDQQRFRVSTTNAITAFNWAVQTGSGQTTVNLPSGNTLAAGTYIEAIYEANNNQWFKLPCVGT